MSRPRDRFRAAIEARVEALGWPLDEVQVEKPRESSHGDLATPVALGLAKPLKRAPREIAAEIAADLDLDPGIFAGVEIAGPGFLNARLAPAYLRGVVDRVSEDPASYLATDAREGERINVEFVSSNPTGPLHVGHARNAALGDAIASLLAARGAEVVREYYFNDAGRQMDVLGASVFARYQQRWDPSVELPEEGYRGAYIGELADAVHDEVGDRYRGASLESCLEVFRTFAGDAMSEEIRRDLERFRVGFDIWFNESTLYDDGRLDATLEDLRERGAVYEKDGATWFRASEYGDDEDRVLVKSTGQPTYLLPDVAYHRDKHERGFDLAIDVWGADHHAYAVRMRAALEALGYPEAWLEPVIYQQISLVESGREVRLSTRANRMVTLRELLDDIGVDVTRYFLLMRKGDTHMTFDLDLARRQTEENPVYYVQYAHARIAGVFERLDRPELAPGEDGASDALGRLEADAELDVLRAIEDFPDLVADAADALEPHRVTDALEDLARRFHAWYHEHRFLVEDDELTRARLALARATQHALREGLALLGVTAPDSM